MARLAGQRNPTSKTATTAMGSKERRARTAEDTVILLSSQISEEGNDEIRRLSGYPRNLIAFAPLPP
jgi:hypothetical protein